MRAPLKLTLGLGELGLAACRGARQALFVQAQWLAAQRRRVYVGSRNATASIAASLFYANVRPPRNALGALNFLSQPGAQLDTPPSAALPAVQPARPGRLVLGRPGLASAGGFAVRRPTTSCRLAATGSLVLNVEAGPALPFRVRWAESPIWLSAPQQSLPQWQAAAGQLERGQLDRRLPLPASLHWVSPELRV